MKKILSAFFVIGLYSTTNVIFAQDQQVIVTQQKTPAANNKTKSKEEEMQALQKTGRRLPPGLNVTQMVAEEYRKSGNIGIYKFDATPALNKATKEEVALKQSQKAGFGNPNDLPSPPGFGNPNKLPSPPGFGKQKTEIETQSKSLPAGAQNGYSLAPPPGQQSRTLPNTAAHNPYGELELKPKLNQYDVVESKETQNINAANNGYTPGPLKTGNKTVNQYEEAHLPLNAGSQTQNGFTAAPLRSAPKANQYESANAPLTTGTHNLPPSNNYDAAPPPAATGNQYGHLPELRTQPNNNIYDKVPPLTGTGNQYGQLPELRAQPNNNAAPNGGIYAGFPQDHAAGTPTQILAEKEKNQLGKGELIKVEKNELEKLELEKIEKEKLEKEKLEKEKLEKEKLEKEKLEKEKLEKEKLEKEKLEKEKLEKEKLEKERLEKERLEKEKHKPGPKAA